MPIGAVRRERVNAQNSKTAIDELRKVIVEKRIDVVALQEPYNRNGIIRGLGITVKIISDLKSFSKSTKSNAIKSAIVIVNPEINILKLEHLCNTHFTCAELTMASAIYYLVSAYFQCSDTTIHTTTR